MASSAVQSICISCHRARRNRQPYRWAIYALLVLVIASGLALTFVMERTAVDIRASLTPQLRARVDAAALQNGPEALNVAEREAETAYRDLMRITRLAHLFDLLALLTAAFMMYHIWARFRSEDALAYQADHDPLTGLAHRRSFERRLQQLPSHAHTVVLGTIDRFERVIGGFGHAFGDRMMKNVASRIRTATESHGGEVFRLDGANIAILFKMAQDHPAFAAALAALQMQMRAPFTSEKHEVFSSLSLGTAEYPRDGREPELLLKNADAALQAARQTGGDTLVAYSHSLNAEAHQKLELEAELSHALERHQLELYYQPQQSLAHDGLIGFEALVRWWRNGQLVAPADFIPLAEESGLIIPIGDWILLTACLQARQWQRQHGNGLVMAVNISPRQFRHPEFLRKVEHALQESGLDPACLELEITEGIVMEDVERSIVLLNQLRALGCKLSIDDFGTGYSSLSYLKRFPITKLKIDQSFVRELQLDTQDAAIVQAVIGLGHNLGMTVIAEGVETASQREWLRLWSCDEIQGYFYGRPQAASATPALLFGKISGATPVTSRTGIDLAAGTLLPFA